MSKIEWTGKTWNFLKGCNLVSKGCENCYAMRMAWRLQNNPKMAEQYAGTTRKTGGGKIQWTGKINIDEERLLLPLSIKKPTVWFVNSMSDLFHEDVPFEIIDRAFVIMKACRQHTFQILTKRPERMLEYLSSIDRLQKRDKMCMQMMDEGIEVGSMICYIQADRIEGWPLPNVWIGVSVEDQKTADERIPLLLQVPATVRFLSCEPLLSEINFYTTSANAFPQDINHPWRNGPILQGIHWVICGGESGPGARPMHPDWARSLRDQCQAAGVAFFFKQWGEWAECSKEESSIVFPGNDPVHIKKVGKKKAGRLLDGKLHDEFPTL